MKNNYKESKAMGSKNKPRTEERILRQREERENKVIDARIEKEKREKEEVAAEKIRKNREQIQRAEQIKAHRLTQIPAFSVDMLYPPGEPFTDPDARDEYVRRLIEKSSNPAAMLLAQNIAAIAQASLTDVSIKKVDHDLRMRALAERSGRIVQPTVRR